MDLQIRGDRPEVAKKLGKGHTQKRRCLDLYGEIVLFDDAQDFLSAPFF